MVNSLLEVQVKQLIGVVSLEVLFEAFLLLRLYRLGALALVSSAASRISQGKQPRNVFTLVCRHEAYLAD